MKKKNWLFAGLILAMLVAVVVPSSSMAALKAWDPVSEDPTTVFAISVRFFGSGGSLWMFDYGANPESSNAFQIVKDTFADTRSVYFFKENNDWFAGYSIGNPEIDLGDSKRFGFFFSSLGDSVSDPYYTEYSATHLQDFDYRIANSDTGMDVVLHDVNLVPISSAFWLFGLGFVGLVGLKRRFWR